MFSSNETRTYLLTTANIDDATLIAIPQGWTAVLNDKDLRITAPAVSGDDVKDGELKILVTPSKAFGKVIKMLVLHELGEVVIGDITPFDNVTPHFLTFEDVDYKGDANMVGERKTGHHQLTANNMVAHYFILRITNSITGVMQTTLFLLPNFLTDGVITNTGVADTQFPIIWIWILLMETSSTN